MPKMTEQQDEALDRWLEILHPALPPELPKWRPSLVDDMQHALAAPDTDNFDVAIAAIIAAAGAATFPPRLARREDWRLALLALLYHDIENESREMRAEEMPTREQLARDLAFLRERLPDDVGDDLAARRALSTSSPSLLRYATVVVLADILG